MRLARPDWSWVGACSIGTSHIRAGTPCDDAGGCIQLTARSGPALLVVASDGAGSAELSRFGSRTVVREFCRSAAAFLRAGGSAAEVNADVAGEWLDDIRDRIDHQATLVRQAPRMFAATLVGVLIQEEAAAVVHVGDGACALRLAGETEWKVPSWPAQGEYASTTYFVTDDPQPRITVANVPGTIEEVAVFTDGIERLALDFAAKEPFQRFFESIFPALRRAPAGRQRALSRDLRAFLDGPSVTDRTDDDKTLVMARRISQATAPGRVIIRR